MWAGPRGPGLLLSSEATVSMGALLPGEGPAHRPCPPSCSSCLLISHPQNALNAGLAPQAFHQLLELSHLITPVCYYSSMADSSLIRCTTLLLLSSPQLRLPGVWGPASPQLLPPQARSSAHKSPLLLKFRFWLHA